VEIVDSRFSTFLEEEGDGCARCLAERHPTWLHAQRRESDVTSADRDGGENVPDSCLLGGDDDAVGNSVGLGGIAHESVEVGATIFALLDTVGVERVVAAGDGIAVHRWPLARGLGRGVMGCKDVFSMHPASLADIHLPREVPVVDVLVLRQAPGGNLFAKPLGNFGVVLREVEKAEGVRPQPLGEAVTPRPGSGGVRLVLLREVGGDEG